MRKLKSVVLGLVLAGVLCAIGAKLQDGPNPCPPGTKPPNCTPFVIGH